MSCPSAAQLWRIMRCMGPLPPHMAMRMRASPNLAGLAAAGAQARGRTLAQRLNGVSRLAGLAKWDR